MAKSRLIFGIGAASSLVQGLVEAVVNAGGSEGDLHRLITPKGKSTLARVAEVIVGEAQTVVKHIIDCDADPFIPEGWKLESHKKMGQFEWDPNKVRLYLSSNQENGKTIKGYDLRKELEEKPVLNANVLDYLLKHQELIPEGWKGKAIFFWGTIYRSSDGNLCVRSLCWRGIGWSWAYDWLDDSWGDGNPAALLASN